VPRNFKTDDGFPLGNWVGHKRETQDRLSPERRQQLNELGIVFDLVKRRKEGGLNYLRAYKQREGHCRVPLLFKTEDGYLLGRWVSNQRQNKEKMSAELRRRLDELGFVWDKIDRDQKWQDGLSKLKAYKEREGHCRVPYGFKTADGFRLGKWTSSQRHGRDKLSPGRRQILDDLGFVWDPFKKDWEDGLGQLRAYKKREGHCRVPFYFTTEDGYLLGRWVGNQRQNKDKMSAEFRRQLDEVGFVWKVK
jgi:hypothetical protein